MGRLAGFKYGDLTRRLKKLGFVFDRQASGSHEIWLHPQSRKRIVIPHHPGDIPEGTIRAIIKYAGVTINDFLSA